MSKKVIVIGGTGTIGSAVVKEITPSYEALVITRSTEPRIDLANADYSFIGKNYSDRLATGVSGGGDINGDGLDDVMMMSRETFYDLDQTGVYYIYSSFDF